MILRPPDATRKGARHASPVPVWDVIAETQHAQHATGAELVPQASHAVLAGVLAQGFSPGVAPQLDAAADVIQAIALHDIGWTALDYEILMGKRPPSSFLDETPERFVRAWTASIEAARDAAALAGLMVSRHFSRLGEYRQAQQADDDADAALIADFLARECKRQELLFGDVSKTVAEVEALVDVLQFADVVSLYLCSGSERAVELPELNGVRYQVERQGEGYVFSPALLAQPVEAAFPVHRRADGSDGPDASGQKTVRSDVHLRLR